MARVDENASKSLMKYVMDIYRDGDLKVPNTAVMARQVIDVFVLLILQS